MAEEREESLCSVVLHHNFLPKVKKVQIKVPYAMTTTELHEKIKTLLPRGSEDLVRPLLGVATSILSFSTVRALANYGLSRSTAMREGWEMVTVRLSIPLLGGKGGFGNLLKQSAGGMNKKRKGKNLKSNTKDLYKTLDGRKVKVIKRIKQLEKQIEESPELERLQLQQKKDKLQRILDIDLEKNVKFDDTKFLEGIDMQLEEIRKEMNDSESDDESGSEGESEESEESEEDEQESSPSSTSTTNKGSKKKFTNFFDRDDE